MTPHWLPIRYREFHDIPRAIVVEWTDGSLYYLCCDYDTELDDYEPNFCVYRLTDDAVYRVDNNMSWVDLEHYGQYVGRIPTNEVTFDSTKRGSIDSIVLERVLEREDC